MGLLALVLFQATVSLRLDQEGSTAWPWAGRSGSVHSEEACVCWQDDSQSLGRVQARLLSVTVQTHGRCQVFKGFYG